MAMRRYTRAATLVIAAVTAATPAWSKGCIDLRGNELASEGRLQITSRDLVQLNDFGPNRSLSDREGVFALSPDRKWIALIARRANIAENAYCSALVIAPTNGLGKPRVLSEVGTPIEAAYDVRGVATLRGGTFAAVTPQWSRDGKAIAFLAKIGSSIQVWKVSSSGVGLRSLTHEASDVLAFRLSADGRSIILKTRPGVTEAQAAIRRQARRGWRYDNRFVPTAARYPLPVDVDEAQYDFRDLRTGLARRATPHEVRDFNEQRTFSVVRPITVALPGNLLVPEQQVGIDRRAGVRQICAAPQCRGRVTTLGWDDKRAALIFMRREGWAREETRIYRWDPATSAITQVLATIDVLSDCNVAANVVICVHEASARPRDIIAIDLDRGRTTTLLDLNREYRRFFLGNISRLHWRNEFGIECIGDFILPAGARPTQKFPLVVVQYDTRGFLRGGTGDEIPFQVMASKGIAVLSISRPPDYGVLAGAKTVVDAERQNLRDFADRRSVNSTIVNGIDLVVAHGVVLEDRIGIAGFSDGASSVQYALINSPRFAAASLGTCCWDNGFLARVGLKSLPIFEAIGYPGFNDPAGDFWSKLSLAQNAQRVRVPILMQVSDSEFLSALPTYTALSQAGVPEAMYIYPSEGHIKLQPEHKLAVYDRNVEWFTRWLLNLPQSQMRAGD